MVYFLVFGTKDSADAPATISWREIMTAFKPAPVPAGM